MIIKRKLYALSNQFDNIRNEEGQSPLNLTPQQPDTMTSKDLQIEQMKLQRQVMQTQRMKQRMESEERLNKARQLAQLQRAKQKEDQEEKENQVKIRKVQEDSNLNPADRNWNLIKSKAKTTAPVSMKR